MKTKASEKKRLIFRLLDNGADVVLIEEQKISKKMCHLYALKGDPICLIISELKGIKPKKQPGCFSMAMNSGDVPNVLKRALEQVKFDEKISVTTLL